MIISASRRTDIPAFFSEWFVNRLKDQYAYVRNPMNVHQISKTNLAPDVVDCIIFLFKSRYWGENKLNLTDKDLEGLEETEHLEI